MKKVQSLLLAVFVFLFVLTGCSNESVDADKEVAYTKSLTYSNLADAPSQDEAKKVMESAGIAAESIDTFFEGVNYFNGAIEEQDLTKEGFTTIDSLNPEYDQFAMQDMWDAKNPEFIGYNCRITSYDLMKDSISIGKPDTKNANWLMFDNMAIENGPEQVFNKEEKEQFDTLYAFVPTEETKDIAVHVKKVKEDWKKKNIQFTNEDKMSLISVFFHDEEGYLFIGHIGVLLPTEDDKLLFLEKVAFQEPYQAVKFNNRVELNDYLMNKYDTAWNQPTAKPFIMENDELLEGYRENPDNPENVAGNQPNK